MSLVEALNHTTDGLEESHANVQTLVNIFYQITSEIKNHITTVTKAFKDEVKDRINSHDTNLIPDAKTLLSKLSILDKFQEKLNLKISKYQTYVSARRSDVTVIYSLIKNQLINMKNNFITLPIVGNSISELLAYQQKITKIQRSLIRLNKDIGKYNMYIENFNVFTTNLKYEIISYPTSNLKTVEIQSDLKTLQKITTIDNDNVVYGAINAFIASHLSQMDTITPVEVTVPDVSINNTFNTDEYNNFNTIFKPTVLREPVLSVTEDIEMFNITETMTESDETSDSVLHSFVNSFNQNYIDLSLSDVKTKIMNYRYTMRYLQMQPYKLALNHLPEQSQGSIYMNMKTEYKNYIILKIKDDMHMYGIQNTKHQFQLLELNTFKSRNNIYLYKIDSNKFSHLLAILTIALQHSDGNYTHFDFKTNLDSIIVKDCLSNTLTPLGSISTRIINEIPIEKFDMGNYHADLGLLINNFYRD